MKKDKRKRGDRGQSTDCCKEKETEKKKKKKNTFYFLANARGEVVPDKAGTVTSQDFIRNSFRGLNPFSILSHLPRGASNCIS